MNVLMIGDIVGPDAVVYLTERLPGLRRAYNVDLVVANAENCAVSAPEPWGGSACPSSWSSACLRVGWTS